MHHSWYSLTIKAGRKEMGQVEKRVSGGISKGESLIKEGVWSSGAADPHKNLRLMVHKRTY